jgi:hypothetical protein
VDSSFRDAGPDPWHRGSPSLGGELVDEGGGASRRRGPKQIGKEIIIKLLLSSRIIIMLSLGGGHSQVVELARRPFGPQVVELRRGSPGPSLGGELVDGISTEFPPSWAVFCRGFQGGPPST